MLAFVILTNKAVIYYKVQIKKKGVMIKRKNGFTMIELLVVIVILGLLSAIGLGSFRSSQAKSRDSRRKAELGQIARALEMYHGDYKTYPDVISVDANNQFKDNKGTVYMANYPSDPAGGQYLYIKIDDRSYVLMAKLENKLDKEVLKIGEELAAYEGVPCAGRCICPSGACNYAIASTNINLQDLFNIVLLSGGGAPDATPTSGAFGAKPTDSVGGGFDLGGQE